METCICSYLPKVSPQETEKPLNELFICEEMSKPKIEECSEVNIKELQDSSLCDINNDLRTENGKQFQENENKDNEVSVFIIDDELPNKMSQPASKNFTTPTLDVLAFRTKNWVLSKKLLQAEAEADCLQQALHSQWSQRNQLHSNIKELEEKKKRLIEETRKSFKRHVDERHSLIQEISETRQYLLNVSKSVSLTESKNNELEMERKETGDCLLKSIAEQRRSHSKSIKNHKRNISTTVTTETDTSTSSYSASLESRFSSSTDSHLLAVKRNKQEYTLIRSGNTTDIISEKSEHSEPNRGSSKDDKNSDISANVDKSIPGQIRLDLSFLEKDIPNHIDSGFSEANNIASKSSVGDCSAVSAIK